MLDCLVHACNAAKNRMNFNTVKFLLISSCLGRIIVSMRKWLVNACHVTCFHPLIYECNITYIFF